MAKNDKKPHLITPYLTPISALGGLMYDYKGAVRRGDYILKGHPMFVGLAAGASSGALIDYYRRKKHKEQKDKTFNKVAYIRMKIREGKIDKSKPSLKLLFERMEKGLL